MILVCWPSSSNYVACEYTLIIHYYPLCLDWMQYYMYPMASKFHLPWECFYWCQSFIFMHINMLYMGKQIKTRCRKQSYSPWKDVDKLLVYWPSSCNPLYVVIPKFLTTIFSFHASTTNYGVCTTQKFLTIISLSMQVSLQVVAPLNLEKLNGARLSLSGDHQLSNAALAVSLCKSWLRSTGNWKRLFEDVGTLFILSSCISLCIW